MVLHRMLVVKRTTGDFAGSIRKGLLPGGTRLTRVGGAGDRGFAGVGTRRVYPASEASGATACWPVVDVFCKAHRPMV